MIQQKEHSLTAKTGNVTNASIHTLTILTDVDIQDLNSRNVHIISLTVHKVYSSQV